MISAITDSYRIGIIISVLRSGRLRTLQSQLRAGYDGGRQHDVPFIHARECESPSAATVTWLCRMMGHLYARRRNRTGDDV